MDYFGLLLRRALFSGVRAAQVVKKSLKWCVYSRFRVCTVLYPFPGSCCPTSIYALRYLEGVKSAMYWYCTTIILTDNGRISNGPACFLPSKEFWHSMGMREVSSSWKTACVEGTMHESKGDVIYLILYDGNSELLESNVKTLRKLNTQMATTASKTTDAADDPLLSANTEHKSCTPSP